MLRVLNIIALLAFFSSFEIASAQNWWKESSLNWLNSPQSKYNRRWKESPLYWRNVQESWYGIRVYGENDDNIIQINLLFDPMQEGYILENQD